MRNPHNVNSIAAWITGLRIFGDRARDVLATVEMPVPLSFVEELAYSIDDTMDVWCPGAPSAKLKDAGEPP